MTWPYYASPWPKTSALSFFFVQPGTNARQSGPLGETGRDHFKHTVHALLCQSSENSHLHKVASFVLHWSYQTQTEPGQKYSLQSPGTYKQHTELSTLKPHSNRPTLTHLLLHRQMDTAHRIAQFSNKSNTSRQWLNTPVSVNHVLLEL